MRIGETVTATVEVIALHPEKHRATLRTVCSVRGEPVLEGEAFSVPTRAARGAPRRADRWPGKAALTQAAWKRQLEKASLEKTG